VTPIGPCGCGHQSHVDVFNESRNARDIRTVSGELGGMRPRRDRRRMSCSYDERNDKRHERANGTMTTAASIIIRALVSGRAISLVDTA
jgi:hypothetical protein